MASGAAVSIASEMDPNWAEQVTAIATAVLALGVFGAVAAALFAAQQVREARQTREAQTTAEFFRRWNEESLIESRRLVSSYRTPDELASAFQRFVSSNSPDAYTLYRELDFFEQLAALERAGAVDTTLIRQLVGRTLADRWDMWEPALRAVHGEEVYPLFRDLAARMRRELGPGAGPRLG
jgi:hypothetical protein